MSQRITGSGRLKMQEILDVIMSSRGAAVAFSVGVSAFAVALLARMDHALPPSSPRRRDARSFDEQVAELRDLQVALAPVRVRHRHPRAR
jgi:hypothetical protein